MSFADDYLAQLDALAAVAPLPRIRALHLPPLRSSAENKGEFFAVELDDGSLGLSYVLLDDTLARLHEGAPGIDVAGADALAVARQYANGTGLARTLGFATANAITRCFFDRVGFCPDNSADSIGEMKPTTGERIGMIGLFTPLLGRVLESGAELVVVELNPALVGAAAGYRVTLDAAELAACSKVVSTGTLLLNDTLDRMLGHCRNATWFAMVGPSAGCLPDALFARGVTMLGGSWVTDATGFIDALRRGEKRGPSARKFALTAANYPGFEKLRSRLA